MELPVEGWQAYVRHKWASLTPSFKEKFCSSTDLLECFLAVCTQIQAEDENVLLNLGIGYSTEKDPAAVPFYKEEGNKKFQKKEYSYATVFYSKAASHAKCGGEDIAVCYANRSAALFYLKHFTVCLEDIERALKNDYPKRLQHKVLIRKADCLLRLGRYQEATDTILKVEELAAVSDLSSTTQQSLLSTIASLRSRVSEKQCNSVFSDVTCLKKQHELPTPLKTLSNDQQDLRVWEESTFIAKTSTAVREWFTPVQGRHIVATRDIDPGETLVKEEAFVSILIPDSLQNQWNRSGKPWDAIDMNADLYCHRCLVRVQATVPCKGCSYAKYCSQSCMDQAWSTYHWAECAIGSILLTLGIFCHVAVRTILVAGFREVSRLVKQHHRDPEEQTENTKPPEAEASYGSSGNEANLQPIYSTSEENPSVKQSIDLGSDGEGHFGSSYQMVFHLLTHTEQQSPEHRFLFALTAAAVCKLFRGTNLQSIISDEGPLQSFSKLKTEIGLEWIPEQRILGVAMLRHMLQLQCNALAVTTLREQLTGELSKVESQEQVRLATAFFPVASLLNHSCDPNTSLCFSGKSVLVRAAQPIHCGEEVSLCYGPHWHRMEFSRRQQILSQQYFFQCECHACLKEQTSKVSHSWDCFCCPNCKGMMQGAGLLSCSSEICTTTIHSERLMHQQHNLQLKVREAAELLEDNKTALALQLLVECQTRAQGFLSSEHILAAQIEDHLAQAHAAHGDWQSAAMHLCKSIRSVKLRHGASSVELGHELFKLAQIYFNGRSVSEAMETISKAEQILQVHYGPQHELLQELQQMKACLLELLTP